MGGPPSVMHVVKVSEVTKDPFDTSWKLDCQFNLIWWQIVVTTFDLRDWSVCACACAFRVYKGECTSVNDLSIDNVYVCTRAYTCAKDLVSKTVIIRFVSAE